jgi:hypothetical protein
MPNKSPSITALAQVAAVKIIFNTTVLKAKSNFPTAAEKDDRYSIGSVILQTTTHERK